MFKRVTIGTGLILIGFSAGLGISYWEKVEIVNLIFYSGIITMSLLGVILFGFELWQHVRTHRQAVARQFDNYSKLSAIPLNPPALPKLEELHPNAKTLDVIECLFEPANGQMLQEANR